MTDAARALIASVPWGELRHARGAADDIPPLLHSAALAKGCKLCEKMDDLCSRVLHQGTVYSASPAVARVTIGLLAGLNPREKPSFYVLLGGLAGAARRALARGSTGDSLHAIAVHDAILDGSATFLADLFQPDAELRSRAAGLLTAFADADPETARLVRQRYAAESDPRVRHCMLAGIERVHACFPDWPEFLAAALTGETFLANRYLLYRAQVLHLRSAADAHTVEHLVSAFVEVHTGHAGAFGGDEPFFLAIHSLGEARERAALLRALDGAGDYGALACALVSRLLRLVFGDRRTGWHEVVSGHVGGQGHVRMCQAAFRLTGRLALAKLFPSAMLRELRRDRPAGAGRVESIRYPGVKGEPPPLPDKLSDAQREVLAALCGNAAVWRFETNLWELFALPDDPAGLAQLIPASRDIDSGSSPGSGPWL